MLRTAFLFVAAGVIVRAQAAPEDKNREIAGAVLPLPEQLRNRSAVVRLSHAGFPESIRPGTNGMVCIADQPGDDQFDVRCYHEAFIAVVYRGFRLDAEGLTRKETMTRIETEIKAGKIKLPAQPTAGYRCLGPAKAYDATTNSLTNEIQCWQSVHFPYRTAKEIGLLDMSELPESMRSKMPYVMSSGSYWSHVMIEHPQGAANTDRAH